MESMELMMKYLYASPRNWFISVMCVVSLVSSSMLGFAEIIRGNNLKSASKFRNVSEEKSLKMRISSRNGMLLGYIPPFVAAFASLLIFPHLGFRFFFLNFALTIHFFKRILEVLFIHKYSGEMNIDNSIRMSLVIFIPIATLIYTQYLTQGYAEPTIDLSYPGIVLFLIGISGNFYHHYLISKQRSKKDQVPKGGLFNLIIWPHYLFEIIVFWGFSFISQTMFAFCFAIGKTLYLMGRSYGIRRWYLSKFEDFPVHVEAHFPFGF